MTKNRVTAGVPTGGQFATSTRNEADVSLTEQNGVSGWKGFADKVIGNFQDNGFTAEEYLPWARVGFKGPEARKWEDAGFEPDDAHEWHAAGFWPERAAEWRQHDDSTPQQAMDWGVEGFGPAPAAGYKKVGVPTGADAAKWARSGYGTTTPDRVRPWTEAGFTAEDADSADDWGKRGFAGEEAGSWLRAGFNTDEAAIAEMWHDSGYPDPKEAQSLRADGFRPGMLSPTLYRRGSTAFKIAQGNAIYEVRTTTPQDAADHGCPGATHVMAGGHEVRYGRLIPATGKWGKRLKMTPGWSQRRSVAADFVCDEDPVWQPLRGYVGE
ncbi:MAG: hypothetical protein M3Y35_04730 [Actinomycetota bacterium]|nr:hypothetical protein [Actinomycetota bacterium]